ncbi:helix-turn-helix domain-containing protein [Brachybacterium alimentarium]|uniref:helix-turn-helix domain-containing protein n=1 Tax=Brachybacterium alimentarium TaxID=47845 RepID=UPI003FD224EE
MNEDEKYLQAVGQQLRAEIAASGRSAASVARMIDMDKTVLHRYLHGTRDIPSTALKRICAAIGVSPAVVLERAEQRMDGNA